MSTMAAHFDTLEQYQTLEAHIIKNTKIHKVLKAIIKLDSVPMDDEYKFKERSHRLLQGWNKILADGVESGNATGKDVDVPNGVTSEDKPNGETDGDPKLGKGSEAQADIGSTKDVSEEKAEDVGTVEADKEGGNPANSQVEETAISAKTITTPEDSNMADTPAVDQSVDAAS